MGAYARSLLVLVLLIALGLADLSWTFKSNIGDQSWNQAESFAVSKDERYIVAGTSYAFGSYIHVVEHFPENHTLMFFKDTYQSDNWRYYYSRTEINSEQTYVILTRALLPSQTGTPAVVVFGFDKETGEISQKGAFPDPDTVEVVTASVALRNNQFLFADDQLGVLSSWVLNTEYSYVYRRFFVEFPTNLHPSKLISSDSGIYLYMMGNEEIYMYRTIYEGDDGFLKPFGTPYVFGNFCGPSAPVSIKAIGESYDCGQFYVLYSCNVISTSLLMYQINCGYVPEDNVLESPLNELRNATITEMGYLYNAEVGRAEIITTPYNGYVYLFLGREFFNTVLRFKRNDNASVLNFDYGALMSSDWCQFGQVYPMGFGSHFLVTSMPGMQLGPNTGIVVDNDAWDIACKGCNSSYCYPHVAYTSNTYGAAGTDYGYGTGCRECPAGIENGLCYMRPPSKLFPMCQESRVQRGGVCLFYSRAEELNWWDFDIHWSTLLILAIIVAFSFTTASVLCIVGLRLKRYYLSVKLPLSSTRRVESFSTQNIFALVHVLLEVFQLVGLAFLVPWSVPYFSNVFSLTGFYFGYSFDIPIPFISIYVVCFWASLVFIIIFLVYYVISFMGWDELIEEKFKYAKYVFNQMVYAVVLPLLGYTFFVPLVTELLSTYVCNRDGNMITDVEIPCWQWYHLIYVILAIVFFIPYYVIAAQSCINWQEILVAYTERFPDERHMKLEIAYRPIFIFLSFHIKFLLACLTFLRKIPLIYTLLLNILLVVYLVMVFFMQPCNIVLVNRFRMLVISLSLWSAFIAFCTSLIPLGPPWVFDIVLLVIGWISIVILSIVIPYVLSMTNLDISRIQLKRFDEKNDEDEVKGDFSDTSSEKPMAKFSRASSAVFDSSSVVSVTDSNGTSEAEQKKAVYRSVLRGDSRTSMRELNK